MGSLSDKYKNNLPFDSSNVTTITSNYTALNNDVVFVNTASSALTVTLPASPTAGSKIKVLDISSNAQNNIITILGNNKNIGGASAYIINTPDSSAEFLFINNTKGWNILNEYISITKPLVPTSIAAIDIGTDRPYNNGAASISFSASTEGDPASSFTAISFPGGYTATGTSSPIVVTGLQSNTSYTFKVFASNAAGNSIESVASSSITATTVPQAPTITSATYGFEKVNVAFTANATGGKAISSFSVTSNPASNVVSGASSPLTVSSLTAGTAYTFTTTATNANGTSAASTASSSATPFTASGGTITTSSGYRIHTFASTSNFILSGNSVNVEYLVIAGGGGGGAAGQNSAGGGGAGGYRCSVVGETSGGGAAAENTLTLAPNTYTATVGGPGSGAGGSYTQGGDGGSSTFSSITSTGGGGGGSQNFGGNTGLNGRSGGSGGGGAYLSNGGSGTTGQGFAGANYPGGGAFNGGGGGAASAGSGSSAGSGRASSINGTSTTRASGGGGGSGAAGGSNTGNGGGSTGAGGAGQNGGSGIVIVRYAI
jgi:hypothetical protein